MAKPRLCFTLLYADGVFHLSRNFKLQSVGNLQWVMDNYDLESISRSVDELFVLNVGRNGGDWRNFLRSVSELASNCFMPIAVGGGIRGDEHAAALFANGADKVVLNAAIYDDPQLAARLVHRYGSQSIVASLDFSRQQSGLFTFKQGGAVATGLDLQAAIQRAVAQGFGELYLTSIDRDGTGNGFDLGALELAHAACRLPIIAAGGADTCDRLAEGLNCGFASAVSTAHLFNFMGDGLEDARHELEVSGIDLAKWNFKELSI